MNFLKTFLLALQIEIQAAAVSSQGDYATATLDDPRSCPITVTVGHIYRPLKCIAFIHKCMRQ